MIKFRCDNCGQKFRVPEIQAGKKGRCPKCKNIITVPNQQNAQRDEIFEVSEYLPRVPTTKEIEQTGQRKYFWLLDILLYPTSKPGLTNLGIIVGVPLLIDIVLQAFGPFALMLWLPKIILRILIGLYSCWYFAECVRDSAAGGTRAPEVFAIVDASTMREQAAHLAACYIIFVGPAGFYFLFTHRTDAVFWFLAAYGLFFFPMGLLAVVMFNSGAAFNPVLLIGSIFSTFLPYCGLLLLISVVALPIIAVGEIPPVPKVARLFLEPVVSCFFLYIGLIVGHLLGRFYWHYQERLNWEV